MDINIAPIIESEAKEIARWRYPEPDDIYNLSESEEAICYVLDPENRFNAIKDNKGELLGFCSFGKDGQVLHPVPAVGEPQPLPVEGHGAGRVAQPQGLADVVCLQVDGSQVLVVHDPQLVPRQRNRLHGPERDRGFELAPGIHLHQRPVVGIIGIQAAVVRGEPQPLAVVDELLYLVAVAVPRLDDLPL